MSLQGADGIRLILRDPLGQDCGHDEDDSHAKHVARVRVQVDDFNVVVVAVPAEEVLYRFAEFTESIW